MSRIGKLAIKLGDKTKAVVAGQQVNFEGPKGKLSVKLPGKVKVEIKDGQVTVQRADDSREARSLHGLTRTILANAAKGVSTGFEKKLDIRGVGFRAEVKGKAIHFALGYSHPVVFDLPEGVTAEVDKTARTEDSLPTVGLTLRSADKEVLGATAVNIRSLRPPEPYKGKGIKYSEERIRRKEGKTGTT
ncbi:50S ribosomal protein L6 [Myxococcus sp. MISCRS1]|jgi:large subunit ribosomal protein L6|uniref:50S ribosomal protein L6 n=1 Tax=Myxococcus TaxID=32 RepID=UPI001CBB3C97|nr:MULTISPECIES: 50S ribosomal protein L6 [unclassified Myxococcus]MBZ4398275.1 50S ribosomal protein L6 [Myxococcus sp. AS-1-15]MBZ4409038.1 50S ribosomal protein L6 [Myxococcus sp. XM-1-1-1]MCY1003208.1 50S ribosomal protein L6 [Myxococcus sp. MISCRS1]BDT35209.1 50S ribosomal protein L6 [Myxococcus sp. MH1]